MTQQEDKDKRTPSEKENGVAEHDKANYTEGDNDSKEGQQHRDDDPSIKQTDDEKKKDDTGGDLAGNASGNSDID
ncbi:hypothetical protein [Sphingobacterium bambusae]|uniref:Uncharacterized protein n=1 Tax=Sphingobacterium bambusae TaxID=662858 RepID=A0ABW6BJ69_9SPHI|nr:hypothetical protein [Sphingobacterium bambusae]WPL48852.1 hypothetical protein SCB77_00025 [Sphingobacterium bambusae]WPL49105.1 hypothetical protein SCB77_01330 [Sphingobacterium bambusae]